MSSLFGQAIAAIFHWVLLVFHWAGGFAMEWNEKAYKWAYEKWNWEEDDGEEEGAK